MANPVLRVLSRWLPLLQFKGSQEYWKERYRLGGDSGAGSSGDAAVYKALVLNGFVEKHELGSVVEFGCGDGRQLEQARYRDYLGVDISEDAVRTCRERFEADVSKRFLTLDKYQGETADLAISIDVIFHLVEDEVYEGYLQRLFRAGRRFVIIYSTDETTGVTTMKHVRHRNVTSDVLERFSGFERMHAEESDLPAPVEYNQSIPTRFFFYRRISAA